MQKLDFMRWKKEYSVDVIEIDLQHKEIMTLINALISHCTGNKKEERKYFDQIIVMAIEQIKKHFDTEIEILDRTKYGKHEEHKNEHDIVLENLKKINNEIKENAIELDLLKMTIYLKDWISDHIESYDKKAKEYFKEGIKDTENKTSPNIA
jgi:hemerythrin